MFTPSVFQLFAAVFVLVSCCEGAPIRDKNKPGNCCSGWKKYASRSQVGKLTLRRRNHPIEKGQHANGRGDVGSGLPSASPSSSFFTWQAAIHGPTGVASSTERSGPFSLTRKNAFRWPQLRTKRKKESATVGGLKSLSIEQKERMQQTINEEEQLVLETSRQLVNTWSDFLCQGSISFGILECVKKNHNDKKTKMEMKRIARLRRQMKKRIKMRIRKKFDIDKKVANLSPPPPSSSLMARFVPFPVKLLEFGKMVESSSPSSDIHSNSNADLVVLGSWEIPLQGGTLILEDEEPSSSSATDYRGKLTFVIAKTTRSDEECKRIKSIESCRNRYQIMTSIVDYRPWLAGGGYVSKPKKNATNATTRIWDALKDNRETTTRQLCHAFYLSTQSMVHAYVTWRFHKKWRANLMTAAKTNRTVEANIDDT